MAINYRSHKLKLTHYPLTFGGGEQTRNIEQIKYCAVLALPGQRPLRCWPSGPRA
jgi:hypothetical protein